jgi:Flp pilus assembly protein TadG
MREVRSAKREGEKGMIMILMAIAIVGLIGAGSLAIDIGSALVTKAELQNVADAASLASTRELATIYSEKFADPDFNYKTYALSNDDKARIDAKAVLFAAANKAGGVPVAVGTADVDGVRYNYDTNQIDYTNTGVQGFEVTGRRDDIQNGQVQTQLARVLGINQIAITAESTAAISALGSLKAGGGEFPIGLDEEWFDTHSCASNEIVQFHPTAPSSCAGWHTFTDTPASASRLRNIVNGIKDGTFQSPETIAGETYFNFTGGTVASAVADLKIMWDYKSGGTGHFRTTVPVYEKQGGCANPSGKPIKIVGFARIDITNVEPAPSNLVEGDVECGIFDEGEIGEGGGGGDYGVLVGSPGMIR